MARDKIHYAVVNALENAGWTVIADPFRIESEKAKMEIDLEAERVLAATNGKNKF